MPILPIKGGGGAEVVAAGNTSFCINEEDLMYENYIRCDCVWNHLFMLHFIRVKLIPIKATKCIKYINLFYFYLCYLNRRRAYFKVKTGFLSTIKIPGLIIYSIILLKFIWLSHVGSDNFSLHRGNVQMITWLSLHIGCK